MRRHGLVWLARGWSSPSAGRARALRGQGDGNLMCVSFFSQGDTLPTTAIPECVSQTAWIPNGWPMPEPGAPVLLIASLTPLERVPDSLRNAPPSRPNLLASRPRAAEAARRGASDAQGAWAGAQAGEGRASGGPRPGGVLGVGASLVTLALVIGAGHGLGDLEGARSPFSSERSQALPDLGGARRGDIALRLDRGLGSMAPCLPPTRTRSGRSGRWPSWGPSGSSTGVPAGEAGGRAALRRVPRRPADRCGGALQTVAAATPAACAPISAPSSAAWRAAWSARCPPTPARSAMRSSPPSALSRQRGTPRRKGTATARARRWTPCRRPSRISRRSCRPARRGASCASFCSRAEVLGVGSAADDASGGPSSSDAAGAGRRGAGPPTEEGAGGSSGAQPADADPDRGTEMAPGQVGDPPGRSFAAAASPGGRGAVGEPAAGVIPPAAAAPRSRQRALVDRSRRSRAPLARARSRGRPLRGSGSTVAGPAPAPRDFASSPTLLAHNPPSFWRRPPDKQRSRPLRGVSGPACGWSAPAAPSPRAWPTESPACAAVSCRPSGCRARRRPCPSWTSWSPRTRAGRPRHLHA